MGGETIGRRAGADRPENLPAALGAGGSRRMGQPAPGGAVLHHAHTAVTASVARRMAPASALRQSAGLAAPRHTLTIDVAISHTPSMTTVPAQAATQPADRKATRAVHLVTFDRRSALPARW